ncbi:alcohol dehydrogenase [Alsobacter soli]|uniref:Alcohol dehydrogenase n=1 Tax=Alsobacter soli TaxID=2109933 RepID=A0A2T1HW85_9HYPH|nr:cytochrome c [Alsobacter soli]PSC05947.1 alcohol dehydrogenase [Alsobacter soli]
MRSATPFLIAGLLVATSAGLVFADGDHAQIERGRYLVSAGDCYACHTADPSKPFAGGRPLQTPFGAIYSANITPDRQTGIGAWSDDDFYRAMHEGVSANGERLYPAFPYPYYTHVTRGDVLAIRAYLQTLEPIANAPPRNKLPFPLSERAVMRPWNWMFFDDGAFHPDPSKSASWNRGAYLVEGLGHCGACHTPKNVLGADMDDKALAGGTIENWFAPNLGADLRTGLGGWSEADVIDYLKTGRNSHDSATGPMSEVIQYSTSQLNDEDLHAVAAYLKDLPGEAGRVPSSASGQQTSSSGLSGSGEAIFLDQCSTCHRSNGEGTPTVFPPLKGNANVQQADATTVIRVILQGARTTPTDARPTPFSMPAFDWKLSDAQIAAVATYVRTAWGNVAESVSADDVGKLRRTLHAKAE